MEYIDNNIDATKFIQLKKTDTNNRNNNSILSTPSDIIETIGSTITSDSEAAAELRSNEDYEFEVVPSGGGGYDGVTSLNDTIPVNKLNERILCLEKWAVQFDDMLDNISQNMRNIKRKEWAYRRCTGRERQMRRMIQRIIKLEKRCTLMFNLIETGDHSDSRISATDNQFGNQNNCHGHYPIGIDDDTSTRGDDQQCNAIREDHQDEQSNERTEPLSPVLIDDRLQDNDDSSEYPINKEHQYQWSVSRLHCKCKQSDAQDSTIEVGRAVNFVSSSNHNNSCYSTEDDDLRSSNKSHQQLANSETKQHSALFPNCSISPPPTVTKELDQNIFNEQTTTEHTINNKHFDVNGLATIDNSKGNSDVGDTNSNYTGNDWSPPVVARKAESSWMESNIPPLAPTVDSNVSSGVFSISNFNNYSESKLICGTNLLPNACCCKRVNIHSCGGHGSSNTKSIKNEDVDIHDDDVVQQNQQLRQRTEDTLLLNNTVTEPATVASTAAVYNHHQQQQYHQQQHRRVHAINSYQYINSMDAFKYIKAEDISELNTLQVSDTVRKLLNSLNIGQRVFAKYVLGLSQGTVSELLSKPRSWTKLTEKGKDSYRKMWVWSNNPEEILALKEISSRRDPNKPECSFRKRYDKESPEITERIYDILGNAAKQIQADNEECTLKATHQYCGSTNTTISLPSDLKNEMVSFTSNCSHNPAYNSSSAFSINCRDNSMISSPSISCQCQSANNCSLNLSYNSNNDSKSAFPPLRNSSSSAIITSNNRPITKMEKQRNSAASSRCNSTGGGNNGQCRQHHIPAMFSDLSTIDVKQIESLNTVKLVQEVKQVLNENSISQRQFGELVLGLSQGSVSDLLARPKCWSALTQKGREPFIRMKLFIDQPAKYDRLFENANKSNRHANSRKESTSNSNRTRSFVNTQAPIQPGVNQTMLFKDENCSSSINDINIIYNNNQPVNGSSNGLLDRHSDTKQESSKVVNWFHNQRMRAKQQMPSSLLRMSDDGDDDRENFCDNTFKNNNESDVSNLTENQVNISTSSTTTKEDITIHSAIDDYQQQINENNYRQQLRLSPSLGAVTSKIAHDGNCHHSSHNQDYGAHSCNNSSKYTGQLNEGIEHIIDAIKTKESQKDNDDMEQITTTTIITTNSATVASTQNSVNVIKLPSFNTNVDFNNLRISSSHCITNKPVEISNNDNDFNDTEMDDDATLASHNYQNEFNDLSQHCNDTGKRICSTNNEEILGNNGNVSSAKRKKFRPRKWPGYENPSDDGGAVSDGKSSSCDSFYEQEPIMSASSRSNGVDDNSIRVNTGTKSNLSCNNELNDVKNAQRQNKEGDFDDERQQRSETSDPKQVDYLDIDFNDTILSQISDNNSQRRLEAAAGDIDTTINNMSTKICATTIRHKFKNSSSSTSSLIVSATVDGGHAQMS
ncbi:hypothetical protein GJ496_004254 [Pomphorhynchus laevis]|nr:hypothetical protein GJ496_004254 [Pomphorhynchus laevis]